MKVEYWVFDDTEGCPELISIFPSHRQAVSFAKYWVKGKQGKAHVVIERYVKGEKHE